MTLPVPQANTVVVDNEGKRTLEDHLLILALVKAVRDLQARVEALEP